MFFNKKNKVEEMNYPEDRFAIYVSKDNNDYFVIVWDIWLKALKECYGRRRLMTFKNNAPVKEIKTRVDAFIKNTKDKLRKEFKEENKKEGNTNVKR